MDQQEQSMTQQSELTRKITISQTVCGICSDTCGINIKLKDGKFVDIEGDGDHPVSGGHICPKGRAIPELFNASDRLHRPLKQTGSSTPSVVSEITEAQKNGCALVVVDPRATSLARKADLHIQLRPRESRYGCKS